MSCQRLLLRCAALIAIVCTDYLPTSAVDRTRIVSFNDSWQSASSWSPAGVPATNDRVFVNQPLDVRLNANSAVVNALVIGNGGGVRTNGHFLHVDGESGLTIISGAGSHLRVNPRSTPGVAFDTDAMEIDEGGLLQMFGGSVEVDASLSSLGTLAGNGLVRVWSGGERKLVNAGTIRAEGGTLTIESIGGGTFDLDSNDSVVEAVDGASTLVINGVLSEEYSATMNIGAGNTIQFGQSWETDTGAINFDAAGGVGTLSGAQLTHGGTINVNSGTGRLSAPVQFQNSSVVNVAAGATIDFGDGVVPVFGTVNLNGGATPSAAAATDGQLQQNFGGTLNISHHAQLNSAAAFLDTADVRINTSNDILRIANFGIIDDGAAFSGDGRLLVMEGAHLTTYDLAANVDVGVKVENQGALSVAFTSVGRLSLHEFEQTSTGSLSLDVDGVSPGDFDTIAVEGNALLAGNLNVFLDENFTPIPGNEFTILETIAGSIGGTFEIENMPTFDGMSFGVVYNPKSVVLQVTEAPLDDVDLDNDGDVDGRDFLMIQRDAPSLIPAWQAAYPGGSSSSALTVPEPTTCICLMTLTPLLAIGFRRRS